jgi:uncharacterized MAPEG superfamily protein
MSAVTGLFVFAAMSFALVSFSVLYTYASQGFGYGFSANRPQVEKSAFYRRVDRTYMNHVENAALVVPLLAAIALLGLDSPEIRTGVLVLILARIGFALGYLSGIPYARLPFFMAGSLTSLYLLYVAMTNWPA